jgi:hypothetical protein
MILILVFTFFGEKLPRSSHSREVLTFLTSMDLQLTEAEIREEDELFNPNDRLKVHRDIIPYRVIVMRHNLSIWFREHLNYDFKESHPIRIINWPVLEWKLVLLFVCLHPITQDPLQITLAIQVMFEEELRAKPVVIVKEWVRLFYQVADRMRTLLTMISKRGYKGRMTTVRALKYGCFSTIPIPEIYYVLRRIRRFLVVELYDLGLYGTP